MAKRRSVGSRFLVLCHLSIGITSILHVASGFTVSRQQEQQQQQQHHHHSSWLAAPTGSTARSLRRQSVLLLGAFPDNDKKRNGRTYRDDDKTGHSRSSASYNDKKRNGRRWQRDEEDDTDNASSSSSWSSYLATCIPGISSALARELTQLGCNQVQITGPSAVRFTANPSTALSTLLWARTPHKIMQLLFAQQPQQHVEQVSDNDVIYNRDDLYNCIRENVNVKDLLGDGRGGLLSLSVSVMFNNQGLIPKDINHSHFTALTIKNALCDAVRDLRGGEDRPNVDLEDPDVPLVAVLRGTTGSVSSTNTRNQDGRGGGGGGGGGAQLSLYRQLHNGSLHRRGYRQEGKAIHKAAMKESLAAGLLLESEWDVVCKDLREQENDQNQGDDKQHQKHPRLVLVDPMAGSGTLLLEGAIMAADLAPHLMRIKCGLTPGGKSQTYPPVVRWKQGGGDGGGNKDEVDVMEEWKRLLQDATVRAKKGLAWLTTETSKSNIELIANDRHAGALNLLESALHEAGLKEGIVKVSQLDCLDFQPFSALVDSSIISHTDGKTNNDADEQTQSDMKVMVVTNPPWGVRLGGDVKGKNDNDSSNDDEEEYIEDEELQDSWEALRVFLRERCPPGKTEAWVLSGNKKSTKHLGLRRSKSIPIKVGQHDLRWIQYEILDKETKMAIMATKQKQKVQLAEQDRQRPLVASLDDEMSQWTSSRRQPPWKAEQQQEEILAWRRQETATTSATISPQPSSSSSSQPKRQVSQSRQKAVSDENEWLLD